MDEQLWNSVQKTRLREPESFASLVELTLPRVFASRDADERLTLAAYQRIGPYLHQLRKGDDFWAWLEQLCGGKSEEEWSQETPPPELAEKARVVAASGEPCRFLKARRVLVGSVLSGFVPAFLAFSSLIFWSNGINSRGEIELSALVLLPTLLMGALMALGFVVGVAPWIAGWKRSFLLGPPAVIVPLSAGMFAAVLPFLARPWLVMAGDRLEEAHINPFLRPEMSLMTSDTFIALSRCLKPVTFWVDNPKIPLWIYAFAFLSMGLGLCLCQMILKRHPWVVQHRVPTWRKGLALFIVLPMLWQLLVVANIYLDGRRIDPSLRTYLANDAPKAQLAKRLELAPFDRSEAYRTVIGQPGSWPSKVEKLTTDEWEYLFQAWLSHGKDLWAQPDWSYHPAANLHARALSRFYRRGGDTSYGPATLEGLVRCGSMRWSDPYAEVPWSQCKLSPSRWEALAQIVVEAMEAPRYPSLEGSFFWNLKTWEAQVEAGLSPSQRANRDQFNLVYRRAELNRCWRLLAKHKTRLTSREPMPRHELQDLSNRFPSTEWPGTPTPIQDLLREQFLTHHRAQALIECEVRARLAAGEPPPASFADFSPQASKLLLPLESWFNYKVVGNSVELEYLAIELDHFTFGSVPAGRAIKL